MPSPTCVRVNPARCPVASIESVASPLCPGEPGASERAQRAAAPAAGAAGDGLGNNTDFASIVQHQQDAEALAKTARRWGLRVFVRQLLRNEPEPPRMSWCGAMTSRPTGLLVCDRFGNVRRSDSVGVYQRPDRPLGRLSGICVCGQSMACPVCAPRVAAYRAVRVAEAFTRAKAKGYSARLETFTMPHARGNDLGDEVKTFARAWAHFQSGRGAKGAAAGILGYHVAREITFGANGWHYHHHVLSYVQEGVIDPEVRGARWRAAVAFVGRDGPGVAEHAYDCGVVGDEAGARYVAKLNELADAQTLAVAREVTSQHNKGRSLFALLCAAADGDVPAGRAWVHAARVITARKISTVRWSRGLAGKLGMPTEADDEVVAGEEQTLMDLYLGSIGPGPWAWIYKHGREFQVVCAAQNGRAAVDALLVSWGLPPLDLPMDSEAIAVVLRTNVDGRADPMREPACVSDDSAATVVMVNAEGVVTRLSPDEAAEWSA